MSEEKLEGTETGLSRRLGLFPATLVGIGVILGAGIYVLVGVASKQAGNAAWLSFLISAIVAGFTGLSYARLCRLRPKNAPEFQFLNLAFGLMPGFLADDMMVAQRTSHPARNPGVRTNAGIPGGMACSLGYHHIIRRRGSWIFGLLRVYL